MGLSAIAQSPFFTPQGENIPNGIKYLLDLNPDQVTGLWSGIELSNEPSGKQIRFPQLKEDSGLRLVLQIIDLAGGGGIIQTVELDQANDSVGELGDQLFFRLLLLPKG